ncbi:MAG: hypothetical protein NTY22_01040 [Proteobacteria bacterium]|nr:hypothetical protein [Pseudomonadota bacterium]
MKCQQKKKPLRAIYLTLYEHFGWLDWWPADSDFEVCVGAILTQNTAWSNVEKAINNLKTKNMMSPGSINSASREDIARLIKPSGYFNQKAEYLKQFCTFLVKNSLNKLKKMNMIKARDQILKVKGIGKETADNILLYALNFPIFVIDAYTKRVFSRIGLVKDDIIYDELQSFFHKKLLTDIEFFKDYHAQIVMLAKTYCKKTPECEKCPLRLKKLCCYCK